MFNAFYKKITNFLALIKNLFFFKRRGTTQPSEDTQEDANNIVQKIDLAIDNDLYDFVKNSKKMLCGLSDAYNNLNNLSGLENFEKEELLIKFKAMLEQLQILNEKISKINFELSYMSTLYNVHLPKLLEYSQQFIVIASGPSLTSEQTKCFTDLLEVFRIKITNHSHYILGKKEEDFLIKMLALNEDVIPNFECNLTQTNVHFE